MTEKRLSLEDVIADMVSKKMKVQASSGGGLDSLGLGSIGDITKLIQEFSKLASLQKGSPQVQSGKPSMRMVHDDGASINAENCVLLPAAPTPVQEVKRLNFDVPKLVDNLVTYMPFIVLKYGDLPLSEVGELIKKNKPDIVKFIEGEIEKAYV